MKHFSKKKFYSTKKFTITIKIFNELLLIWADNFDNSLRKYF